MTDYVLIPPGIKLYQWDKHHTDGLSLFHAGGPISHDPDGENEPHITTFCELTIPFESVKLQLVGPDVIPVDKVHDCWAEHINSGARILTLNETADYKNTPHGNLKRAGWTLHDPLGADELEEPQHQRENNDG